MPYFLFYFKIDKMPLNLYPVNSDAFQFTYVTLQIITYKSRICQRWPRVLGIKYKNSQWQWAIAKTKFVQVLGIPKCTW